MNTTSRIALVLMSALAFAHPAASFVIDDFESGDFVLVDTITTGGGEIGEQSGLPGTSVRGGVRLVTANATTTTGVTATASLATAPVVDDSLSLTAVNAGGTFGLFYDGIANGTFDFSNGTLGLDLSSRTAIQIDTTAGDTGASLRAYLYDSSGNQFSPLYAVGTGSLVIALSIFDNLDLSDIQAIRFFINGVSTTNPITISQIAAIPVPEPGTALLLGLGLTAIALRRRDAR